MLILDHLFVRVQYIHSAPSFLSEMFVACNARNELVYFYFFRNAWLALGEMTKDEAMRQFIAQVEELMPMVKPFLEAQQQAEEKEIEEM